MSLIAISYPELPKKDFDSIQSLRKKYDNEGYALLNAHITFVFPTDNIKQEPFLSHILPKINSFPKIQFELTHFKLSIKPQDGKWFIFIIPEKGKNEIIELHDILYSDLLAPELSLEFPFDPHITIGCLKDKDKCLSIIEDLNKNDICVNGQISSIDAATYENNQIETIKNIVLK